MKNNNLTLMYVGIIIVAFAALIIVSNMKETPYQNIKNFNSVQELKDYLSQHTQTMPYYGSLIMETALPSVSKSSGAVQDYSTTNVQVAGVDEGDIVKTDGSYIYTISGNHVFIVDADMQKAKILSNISSDGIKEIYINGDKLVLIGQQQYSYGNYNKMMAIDAMPIYYNPGGSYIQVYDVSDRSNPLLVENFTEEGNYLNSRMIDSKVYFLTQQYTYSDRIPFDDLSVKDVYYFDDYSNRYTFTTVASLNIDSREVEKKTYLIDSASNVYVSKDNIYITYEKQVSKIEYMQKYMEIVMKKPNMMNKQQVENGSFEDVINTWMNGLTDQQRQDLYSKQKIFDQEIQKENDKTIIHKISISNGIVYKAKGELPGHLLNQFSMDENNGYFRVATTTGDNWNSKTNNNVYVLNSDLTISGSVEDLAPGETIYSARFMGDRAYLVTFKTVDPLFVLDLKDPTNPKLMGKLKIPGYSDYLHPYDENHLIGIGKDVDESIDADKVHTNDAVYYTAIKGVKISLFDVTDIEKPKEISNLVIGDRGSDSYALKDHKAFLFDKNKNLLVIPILKAVIDKSQYPNGVPTNAYGDFVDQGAYVFHITLDGIKLRGSVSHENDFTKFGYYYESDNSVKRSLYIGNNLYTISNSMIKISDLDTLKEINNVSMPVESRDYPILYY